MIQEYDHVKIKNTGNTGIVVDIRNTNGTYYLVQRDDDNELIDCTADELEKIQPRIITALQQDGRSSLSCEGLVTYEKDCRSGNNVRGKYKT